MSGERHVFDYGAGSGSGSAEDAYTDENQGADLEEWNTNRTSFSTHDKGARRGILRSDGQRIPYDRLRSWNCGKWANDRGQRTSKAGQKRDVETFADQIGLSSLQQQRALEYFDDADFADWGNPSAEAMALAVIKHSLNKDDIPVNPALTDDDDARANTYWEIVDACGVERDTINRIQRSL